MKHDVVRDDAIELADSFWIKKDENPKAFFYFKYFTALQYYFKYFLARKLAKRMLLERQKALRRRLVK